MKKTILGIILGLSLVLMTGCNNTQEIVETGENQTMNNKDLVVEWAPIYTNNGAQLIDVNDKNNQTLLYNTQNLMFSNQKTNGTVSLTTNGCLYIGDSPDDTEGSLYLVSLLTNRTEEKITNIHYEIQIVNNASGEVLGESSFDIPANVYGDSIEPNQGYMALLPFPDSLQKKVGTTYTKDEITVYSELSYDKVTQ